MGAKNFPTPIGQQGVVWRNELQGFSQKIEKCWQNGGGDGGGGGGNGPKTISAPVTRGDLINYLIKKSVGQCDSVASLVGHGCTAFVWLKDLPDWITSNQAGVLYCCKQNRRLCYFNENVLPKDYET